MLNLRGIEKAYPLAGGTLPVLKGIDLTIQQGEMVAIMGSSGSGKSTLLNVLGLLDGFDSGGYDLDGVDMSGLSEKQAARYRSQFLGFGQFRVVVTACGELRPCQHGKFTG